MQKGDKFVCSISGSKSGSPGKCSCYAKDAEVLAQSIKGDEFACAINNNSIKWNKLICSSQGGLTGNQLDCSSKFAYAPLNSKLGDQMHQLLLKAIRAPKTVCSEDMKCSLY